MHLRLGHRSTISLLAGDTANVWEDIELIIYPDPFCTSCQISSMKKKARSKNPLKPKVTFKQFLMDIIPSTAPKRLTDDIVFHNYILIVDALSKISKLYGMDKISTVPIQIWINRKIWMVGFRKNFSRCRYKMYLHGVQKRMPIPRSSLDVSSSGKSGNKDTGWSDRYNVAYDCTLTYGTCVSLGSVYSFCINLYDRS